MANGRHLQTVQEPHLRSKWQACKKALLQESHLVREVNKERDSFAAPRPAAAPPRGLENTPVSSNAIFWNHDSPRLGDGDGSVACCRMSMQQAVFPHSLLRHQPQHGMQTSTHSVRDQLIGPSANKISLLGITWPGQSRHAWQIFNWMA